MFLFTFFLSCMIKGTIPLQRQSAKEICIPKVNHPTAQNISDVEGKLFFSLVSKRLEKDLIGNNKFINKSVQKGSVEKVPGCWEHIPMVCAALKEAKSKKLSLASIWLDISNAYWSIPHKQIIFALHHMVAPKNGSTYSKCTTLGYSASLFLRRHPGVGIHTNAEFLLVALCQ